MPRLDIEKQERLEPKRMGYAKKKIESKGFSVNEIANYELRFEHKGEIIKFFPYSGWATGKTIKDGRGLNNLLKQLVTERINKLGEQDGRGH